MSDLRFPMSLRPIVSKGYSQTRGSNIWRTEVQGGVPRQGRDTYFEPVPISVTLVVSSLGRQAFYSFLNNIDGGASSFIMPHDTGLGLEDHQVLITSDISDSTDDGKNWVITFTATAERTAIQEDTCLTKNLPDLYGCYGDCLGSFLKIYANYETTFPRIWSDEGPAGYPPINLLASALDSRIVYDGPQVYYINRNGNLVQSATNEWPLTFIDGVAVGRVPPEVGGLNLLKMSEDLSDPVWAKTRTTVTYGGTQDPTGGTGASKLVPTTTTGTHNVLQLITPEASTAYTYSVFVKANGYNNALVQIGVFASQVASNPVYVDLSTGVITSANDYSRCGIIAVGDGWFRVWVRVITNSSPTSINASVWASDAANNTSFPSDGVSAISVFGAQMEKSTNSSSYIKTEENLITRPTASAKVVMSGATSIDITYSDDSVVNVPSVDGYASIPQADSAWGSKYITRIDFNVDG
ncbi:hypothetical protein CPT_Snoke_029 [Escherichia phage Snoke]|nr:hypothetical protein CPT_Snoke_029 [Escherichia phage Snoke]